MKMAASRSPAGGAESPGPHSSVRPQRTAPNDSRHPASGRAPSWPSLRPVQGNPELRVTPRLCLCSRLPRSNTGKLCDTQTPPILLRPCGT